MIILSLLLFSNVCVNDLASVDKELRKNQAYDSFIFSSKRLQIPIQNFIYVNYAGDSSKIYIHTIECDIFTTREIELARASDINQLITAQTTAIIFVGKITEEVEKFLLKDLCSPYEQVINIYIIGNQYITKESISYQLRQNQLKRYPYDKSIRDWP